MYLHYAKRLLGAKINLKFDSLRLTTISESLSRVLLNIAMVIMLSSIGEP